MHWIGLVATSLDRPLWSDRLTHHLSTRFAFFILNNVHSSFLDKGPIPISCCQGPEDQPVPQPQAVPKQPQVPPQQVPPQQVPPQQVPPQQVPPQQVPPQQVPPHQVPPQQVPPQQVPPQQVPPQQVPQQVPPQQVPQQVPQVQPQAEQEAEHSAQLDKRLGVWRISAVLWVYWFTVIYRMSSERANQRSQQTSGKSHHAMIPSTLQEGLGWRRTLSQNWHYCFLTPFEKYRIRNERDIKQLQSTSSFLVTLLCCDQWGKQMIPCCSRCLHLLRGIDGWWVGWMADLWGFINGLWMFMGLFLSIYARGSFNGLVKLGRANCPPPKSAPVCFPAFRIQVWVVLNLKAQLFTVPSWGLMRLGLLWFVVGLSSMAHVAGIWAIRWFCSSLWLTIPNTHGPFFLHIIISIYLCMQVCTFIWQICYHILPVLPKKGRCK